MTYFVERLQVLLEAEWAVAEPEAEDEEEEEEEAADISAQPQQSQRSSPFGGLLGRRRASAKQVCNFEKEPRCKASRRSRQLGTCSCPAHDRRPSLRRMRQPSSLPLTMQADESHNAGFVRRKSRRTIWWRTRMRLSSKPAAAWEACLAAWRAGQNPLSRYAIQHDVTWQQVAAVDSGVQRLDWHAPRRCVRTQEAEETAQDAAEDAPQPVKRFFGRAQRTAKSAAAVRGFLPIGGEAYVSILKAIALRPRRHGAMQEAEEAAEDAPKPLKRLFGRAQRKADSATSVCSLLRAGHRVAGVETTL